MEEGGETGLGKSDSLWMALLSTAASSLLLYLYCRDWITEFVCGTFSVGLVCFFVKFCLCIRDGEVGNEN